MCTLCDCSVAQAVDNRGTVVFNITAYGTCNVKIGQRRMRRGSRRAVMQVVERQRDSRAQNGGPANKIARGPFERTVIGKFRRYSFENNSSAGFSGVSNKAKGEKWGTGREHGPAAERLERTAYCSSRACT